MSEHVALGFFARGQLRRHGARRRRIPLARRPESGRIRRLDGVHPGLLARVGRLHRCQVRNAPGRLKRRSSGQRFRQLDIGDSRRGIAQGSDLGVTHSVQSSRMTSSLFVAHTRILRQRLGNWVPGTPPAGDRRTRPTGRFGSTFPSKRRLCHGYPAGGSDAAHFCRIQAPAVARNFSKQSPGLPGCHRMCAAFGGALPRCADPDRLVPCWK